MFCVYWQDSLVTHDAARSKMFLDMGEALKHSEAMRKVGHRFVSMASEVPGNVTKMGVDVTGPDYDWKKRRR